MSAGQLKFQAASQSKWNRIVRVSSCVEQGFAPDSLYLPPDPYQPDTWKEWAGEINTRSPVICRPPIPGFTSCSCGIFCFFSFPDCFVMFLKGFKCTRISCVLYVLRGENHQGDFQFQVTIWTLQNLNWICLPQVISVECWFALSELRLCFSLTCFPLKKKQKPIVSVHRCFWDG